MKIQSEHADFVPVIITVESAEELIVLERALFHDDPSKSNLAEVNVRLHGQVSDVLCNRGLSTAH